MSVDVPRAASLLRMFATHFDDGDWSYSRKTGIRHIRMDNDSTGYDALLQRARRWARAYVTLHSRTWVARAGRQIAWRHPIIHARTSLMPPDNAPDGQVGRGRIIVHWEEDGEYLVLVKPTIGAMIADLMEAHPDLPEVQRVAAAMLDSREALLNVAREEGFYGGDEDDKDDRS